MRPKLFIKKIYYYWRGSNAELPFYFRWHSMDCKSRPTNLKLLPLMYIYELTRYFVCNQIFQKCKNNCNIPQYLQFNESTTRSSSTKLCHEIYSNAITANSFVDYPDYVIHYQSYIDLTLCISVIKYLIQKHLRCKKCGKVTYLEENTWTDWWQQDLISDFGQGACIYWTHIYYTGHIVASYCFQSLVVLSNNLFTFSHILLQISYFKKLIREHESHNYLSFGCLFISDYIHINKKEAKWQIIVTSILSCLSFKI